MNYLQKAIGSSRALSSQAMEGALRVKASSDLVGAMTSGYYSGISQWQQQAKYNERYSLFAGDLYSAVNAIASTGAAQPVCVGKRVQDEEEPTPKKTKSTVLMKMTRMVRQKAQLSEVELLQTHPLLNSLRNPNPVQKLWQFTYSFIANLCLTGWSFVIADTKKDGTPEFWSLPTTWVRPDHTNGPFSRFKIVNPNKPSTTEDDWIPRENVGFAHFPNPADPMSALSPTASQMPAIRISDHIQSSREQFFSNGVFPSLIVTIGKDPHPDVPGGVRPRLSAAQRRQVESVIRRTMSGVVNYGNPAIVDGLIESIDRLSMTQNEMGWEKSDETVQAKILSAFGVHPFILGRVMNVGGYAQATIIREIFYDKVNTYLDFLAGVMTSLVGGDRKENELVVWWEACEAIDKSQRDSMIRFARQNNDISQDELRGMLGLGPDEDRNQQLIDKAVVPHIVTLLGQVGQGAVEPSQMVALLEGLGLPTSLAKQITGKKKPQATPPAGQPPIPPGTPTPEPEEEEPFTPEEAAKMLRQAIGELRRTDYGNSRRVADMIVDMVSNG